MEELIILPESDLAAEKVTMEVWKSKNGEHFLTEEAARKHGATHLKCECGNIFLKECGFTKCDECRIISAKEYYSKRYNNRELKEWDEKTTVYSEIFEKYFFSPDEIDDFIDDFLFNIGQEKTEENKIKFASNLRLIICNPEYPYEIDEDYWRDIIPEGCDFGEMASKKFKDALWALNKAISEEEPWSWTPGEFRTEFKIKKD